MANTQIDVLNEIAKKLNALRKELCCKLDQVTLAAGGTPALYNTVNSEVIAPGNSYTSPEVHGIEVIVYSPDDPADTADVIVNGVASTWPTGLSWNKEATTVFEPGMFTVEDTSTAYVIVSTISQS